MISIVPPDTSLKSTPLQRDRFSTVKTASILKKKKLDFRGLVTKRTILYLGEKDHKLYYFSS